MDKWLLRWNLKPVFTLGHLAEPAECIQGVSARLFFIQEAILFTSKCVFNCAVALLKVSLSMTRTSFDMLLAGALELIRSPYAFVIDYNSAL